jgi:hypothetical protein
VCGGENLGSVVTGAFYTAWWPKNVGGSGDGCVVWRSEWGLVRRALELEGASDTGPGAMMRVHSESWGFGGG